MARKAREPKTLIIPGASICHDDKDEGYVIEVEFPGVVKKDIGLYMYPFGFCARGERADIRYEVCYSLGHEIRPKDAKAKFRNGLLKVTVPFRESLKPTEVAVE